MFTQIVTYAILLISLILATDLFVYVYGKLTTQQRENLDRLAQQAVSMAEKIDAPGEAQMSEAIDFVANQINGKFHTKFTPEQIQSAIQFAYDHSPFIHKKEVKEVQQNQAQQAQPVQTQPQADEKK